MEPNCLPDDRQVWRSSVRAAETDEWFTALVALPEIMDLFPRTHMATHKDQSF